MSGTLRAAVLRHHHDYATFKVILLVPGQSEEIDHREWLLPHLGRDYHLMEFTDAALAENTVGVREAIADHLLDGTGLVVSDPDANDPQGDEA